MGFIKEFIKRKENEIIKDSNKAVNKLTKEWSLFAKKDAYLIYDDKSEVLHLINSGNKETIVPWYFFWNFKLKSNLKSNLEALREYEGKVKIYNQNFVISKKKQYNYLFKKDDLTLDDDQQTAIITDDKHNLVVAGAGSGKTEVLITRIAYLIKRKGDTINPNRILALAFQNKASKEVKERLKKRYGVDVEIRTFHGLGRKIIDDASKIKGVKAPQLKEDCSEDWKYQRYIQTLFNKEISINKKLQNEVINFMKHYGDDERIKEEAEFKEKEEFYNYRRNLTYTALDGTQVRSESEREILNFFLMNKLNGDNIKILYENSAVWMKYKNEEGEEIIPRPDFYFPDFDIYLEHWAVGKNGKVPSWFSGSNPTEEYANSMNIKKEKYKQNNKQLFETSQADVENNNLQEVLAKRFMEVIKKVNPEETFSIAPLSYKELVESVWESAKFVKQVPMNISNFITIAKTYRLYPKDIDKRLINKKWSLKQSSFAKIANQIYEIYQKEFEKGNYIDFSDMINVAVDYLKNNPTLYKDKYDHILIDEYQDISTQRYEMIKELMNKNKSCKLFCVGDDWQSIMGFAGSNLDFFINFGNYFKHPARTDLTKNYRSIKSIVDVGACIIKNNKEGQIKKETFSNSDKTKPILVYSSKHQKKFFSQYYEQIAKHCLDMIKEYHTKENYHYSDFMILLRIANKKKLRNFISEYAQKLGIPISEKAERVNCVRIMSVHKSKGLQAKVVMILNVDKDLYGFPCELENPDIFQPAIKNNDGLREQEERRLFYVAVTRAKEEVIMYTQKNSESDFITEIKEFVKREELGY
ncbi:UvrD-helicase domain-containing protein [Candidatus Woesearchaeota archaeon]|jgi:DNA helicase IV|nr:UvrD-helicase domain-containing protein [Candidatus Woesearchaeota archaeon]MBT5272931.1 UvrD-helicase domain-containing protein [Candidatus Woesearchaeota archaeon]MBT6041397.1 UvrD-helicase domain-containing protein [Candidatus Woesearchaeota archaeon]MBT6337280.1 UvrD-helicase domain-containing protein [Candidatus Woesearchaeota archaeon]MBT7927157.1 UvrD-helicase domain-containing protein [Candidatus Woesearchaeota archaeon]